MLVVSQFFFGLKIEIVVSSPLALLMRNRCSWCCFAWGYVWYYQTINFMYKQSITRIFVMMMYDKWRYVFRDKVLTGSFDKTAKLWSAESGKCFHTYRGHTSEIVSLCCRSIIVITTLFISYAEGIHQPKICHFSWSFIFHICNCKKS